MINYYRRFFPECSRISQPIQDFICKRTKWSTPQDSALAKLKEALSSHRILVPFKQKGTYRLTIDTSIEGMGAVVEEVENNKLVGFVGSFSRTLEKEQKN